MHAVGRFGLWGGWLEWANDSQQQPVYDVDVDDDDDCDDARANARARALARSAPHAWFDADGVCVCVCRCVVLAVAPYAFSQLVSDAPAERAEFFSLPV